MTNVMSMGIGVFIAGRACAYMGLHTGPQMGQLISGAAMASVGVLIVVHEGFEIARERKHRHK